MTPCCGGRVWGQAKLKLSWRRAGCPARIDFTTPPLPPPCILGGCGALKRLTLHWGGSCCRWRGESSQALSKRHAERQGGTPRIGAPLQQHEEGSPDLCAFFFFLLSIELYLHTCMHACSWVHFRTGGSSDRSRQPGSFEPPSHPPGTELPRQAVLPVHDPWRLAETTANSVPSGQSRQKGSERPQDMVPLSSRRLGVNIDLYFEVSATSNSAGILRDLIEITRQFSETAIVRNFK